MMRGTYLFKDKDPVIDVLRTALQLYASIEGIGFAAARKRIAIRAGLTDSALYGWFNGDTRFPYYKNVAAVVIALGLSVDVGQRKLDTLQRTGVYQRRQSLRLVKPSTKSLRKAA